MNSITIKNLSSYRDHSAVSRVARFIANDEYHATRNKYGKEIIKIIKHGNTYTVIDKEKE